MEGIMKASYWITTCFSIGCLILGIFCYASMKQSENGKVRNESIQKGADSSSTGAAVEKAAEEETAQTSVEGESGFCLKLEKGQVMIYDSSGKYLYQETGIMEDQLSKEDKQLFERTYQVRNEKELYSLLENLSS